MLRRALKLLSVDVGTTHTIIWPTDSGKMSILQLRSRVIFQEPVEWQPSSDHINTTIQQYQSVAHA
jgi:hypothetical protein